METHFKQMTNFIRSVGADDIEHSERTYLAHAIGVANDLRKWGCNEEMCDAAVFHSIYGTELFQRFTLPLERRDEVRELIGETAEKFAYLNCAMDRAKLDESIHQTTGPYFIGDRFAGEDIELTEAEFDDLVRMHLCDWLEQVGHSKSWDYRRDAYHQMAVRLGDFPLEEYDRVFAMETE